MAILSATLNISVQALKFTALDFDQKVQVDIDQVFDTTTKQITNIGKTVFNYTEVTFSIGLQQSAIN